MRRTGTVVLIAAVVALAAACVPEPPPPPDPLITCDQFAVAARYSPPATNSADDVAGTVDTGSGLSGCTDRTGSGITSAVLAGTIQADGACSSHAADDAWVQGSGQITWSDGSTSAWSGELVGASPLRANLTLTGGRWAGSAATLELYVDGSTGSCASDGLSRVSLHGGPFVLHPAGAGPRPLTAVQSVTAGGYHACAVVSDVAKCWGDDSNGQIGDGTSGTPPEFDALVPSPVVGLGPVSKLSAGEQHTCALLPDGAVRCWGANGYGQLGDGTTTPSNVPVAVPGLTATDIAAGDRTTCAVVGGGGVSCWGGDALTPTPVAGITTAQAVSVGGSPTSPHACALLAGGSIVCWGDDTYGQLGDGAASSGPGPVPVTGISGASAVVAGPYGNSCAVVDGGVWCWGRNNYGQLGDGTTSDSPVPVAVTGITEATGVGLGAVHGCAVLANGTARCWGNGNYGQLGAGATTQTSTPVAVEGLTDATSISVGHYSTCARRAFDTAVCWGANADGQLGNGGRSGSSVPVPVIASL